MAKANAARESGEGLAARDPALHLKFVQYIESKKGKFKEDPLGGAQPQVGMGASLLGNQAPVPVSAVPVVVSAVPVETEMARE